MDHVLFGFLTGNGTDLQFGSEIDVEALAAESVRFVQMPEVAQLPRTQPGLASGTATGIKATSPRRHRLGAQVLVSHPPVGAKSCAEYVRERTSRCPGRRSSAREPTAPAASVGPHMGHWAARKYDGTGVRDVPEPHQGITDAGAARCFNEASGVEM